MAGPAAVGTDNTVAPWGVTSTRKIEPLLTPPLTPPTPALPALLGRLDGGREVEKAVGAYGEGTEVVGGWVEAWVEGL